MMRIVHRILDTFRSRGNEKYGEEEVTQLQHALQCAGLAATHGASNSLVLAALLHDIGHLLGPADLPTDCQANLDDGHESLGHAFLLQHFGDAVAEPVRLHVAAKRYLCTQEADYQRSLSPTSYKSFLDQGGLMSAAEQEAFAREPYFEDALRLRRWDDLGKDPALSTRPIEEFAPLMERLAGE